jgi:hypothetical protein
MTNVKAAPWNVDITRPAQNASVPSVVSSNCSLLAW